MDLGAIKRVWLPLVLVAFVLHSIWHRTHPGNYRATQWIGLGLALIGVGGVFLSRYTLGKSFSVRAKATALVTTGIYARIRNPIYVSGVIAVIGIAIMTGRPVIMAMLAVIIPLQIWRARNEARVLEEKFGNEYREYRRRTWF